jgi:hypothetical protein
MNVDGQTCLIDSSSASSGVVLSVTADGALFVERR